MHWNEPFQEKCTKCDLDSQLYSWSISTFTKNHFHEAESLISTIIDYVHCELSNCSLWSSAHTVESTALKTQNNDCKLSVNFKISRMHHNRVNSLCNYIARISSCWLWNALNTNEKFGANLVNLWHQNWIHHEMLLIPWLSPRMMSNAKTMNDSELIDILFLWSEQHSNHTFCTHSANNIFLFLLFFFLMMMSSYRWIFDECQ